MRNKMLRKISVLLLSLTMVMTSMNLSFALDGEISDSANSQVSEQIDQGNTEQQTEEAVTPVPNQETSGEKDLQEENSEKTTGGASDATGGQTKPKKAALGVTLLGETNGPVMPSGKTETLYYNGSNQTLNLGGTNPSSGYRFAYVVNPFVWSKTISNIALSYVSNSAEGKDAGEYTVYWAYIKNGKYYDTIEDKGSFKVSIEKKTVEINWGNTSFVYNGEEQGPTPTVNNIEGNDKVSLQYSGKGKDVQVDPYIATVTGLQGNDKDNYILPTECSAQFYITPAIVDENSLVLNESQIRYTGSEIKATVKSVTASNGKLNLSSGDYDITGNTGTEIGDYTLTVTGKGNFKGTASKDWKIVDKTPTQVSVTGKTSLVYNKQDQELIGEANVTEGDGDLEFKLTKGTETIVGWTTQKSDIKATDAGEYTIEYKVEETTDYAAASGSIGVSVAKAEINSVTLGSNPSYNTQEQTIEISSVKTKNNVFLQPTDYKISGNKGTDAGRYAVKVEPADGNSNLVGSKIADWKISKADVPTIIVTPSNPTYNGEDQNLITSAVVKFGNVEATGIDVLYTTDVDSFGYSDSFSTTIPTGKDAGDYKVYYGVIGNDNYKGMEKAFTGKYYRNGSVECQINKKELIDSNISVVNERYTGNDVSPTITVTDGSKTLVKDEDYEITGQTSGTEIGPYQAIVKGKGNYSGELEVAWKIVAFFSELDNNEFAYNRNEHEVSLSVKGENGVVLEKGRDYEVDNSSVFKAINAGTYKVKVKGIGKYADVGEVVVDWKITPEKLAEGDLSLKYDNKLKVYFYDGEDKTVTPVVIHRMNGAAFVLTNEDFKVVKEESVTTAKDAGTYTVFVEGTGNYCGKLSTTWEIQGIPFDWIKMSLGETEYTYDGKKHEPEIKIGIINEAVKKYLGRDVLVEGEDYVISGDRSATDVGEYTIHIQGKKYFKGTVDLKWRINKINLSDCEIKVVADKKITIIPPSSHYEPKVEVSFGDYKVPSDEYVVTGDLEKEEEGVYHVNVVAKEESKILEGSAENLEWIVGTDVNNAHLIIVPTNWNLDNLWDNFTSLLTQKYSKEYDGETFTPAVWIVFIPEGFSILNPLTWKDVTIERVTSDKYEIEGADAQKDAGEYTIKVRGKDDEGRYGTQTATWSIEPRNVSLIWNDKEEFVYNGAVQRKTGEIKHITEFIDFVPVPDDRKPGIVDADKGKVEIEYKALSVTKPINAGTYITYAKLNVKDETFNPKNYDFNYIGIGDYEIAKAWVSTYTIKKKPVTVKWLEDNPKYQYDGKYHIPQAVADGVVEGDICLLDVEGAAKDIGKHTAKVTGIALDSKLLGDNYELNDNNLTKEFEITGRNLSEPKYYVDNTTYNGEKQTPAIVGYDFQGILGLDIKKVEEGKDFVIDSYYDKDDKRVEECINAGTYKVKLTALEGSEYIGETYVEWTIDKAIPTYSISAINESYKAIPQDLVEAEFTGTACDSDCEFKFCVKDSVIDVFSGLDKWESEAKRTNADTYLVYYRIKGDRNHYDVGANLLHVRAVTIDKAQLTKDMISLEYDEYTYDGRKHSPKITVTVDGNVAPENDYYVYRVFPWSSDVSAVNAGNYHLYITADLHTSGNFYDSGLVIDKTWKINAKPVSIVFDRKSLTTTYGDNGRAKAYVQTPARKDRFTLKPILTYTGTSYTGVKYNGTKVPTEAGVYTVTARINNPNYIAEPVKAKFVVKRKTIEEGTVKLGNALIYNGRVQKQDVTGLVDGSGKPMNVTFRVVRNTGKDAGEYKLVVIGTGNYKGRIVKTFAIAPDTAEGSEYQLGEGRVEMQVDAGENVEAKYDIGALIKSLVETGELDAEKLSQIADGEEVILNLTVKDVTGKTEEPQTYDKFKIGQEFDINLTMSMLEDGEVIEGYPIEVSETTSTISFKLKLNDALINTNKDYIRDYVVIRKHDGSTSILSTAYNKDDNSVSFSTNKFSYYAVGYMDAKIIIPGVATGDDSNIYLFLMLGLAAAIAGAAAVARRRKEN